MYFYENDCTNCCLCGVMIHTQFRSVHSFDVIFWSHWFVLIWKVNQKSIYIYFHTCALQILQWAHSVLNAHAERKSVLEIEFMNEEGTGLGPSLEFYALVSAEFQCKGLGMWLCDDDDQDDQSREVCVCVWEILLKFVFNLIT